ncbi:hypothetical protein DM860_017173 [Cuscuta australis]|uniref:3-methyl-2-oxobutanoate hydroxymethyltransferase n=1 Tax=Cuscuta australis TaxID=267555 RepID=A0A328DYB9_9ASTE|nr:hypothetical protein DM860_017173 [Cuscuta australis]
MPENTVYGGPKLQDPNKRTTLATLRQKHHKGEPITMVTAYDYPSAVHLDMAGIDICLVGDSAAIWWFTAMTPLCPSPLTRCLCIVELLPKGLNALSLFVTSLSVATSRAPLR